MSSGRLRRFGLPLVLFLSGVFCYGGFRLARHHVPEWRLGEIPPQQFFVARFHEVASAAGWRVIPEEPQVDVVSWVRDLSRVYRVLKSRAPEWLLQSRRAVMVEVSQLAVRDGAEGRLSIDFSLGGEPWYVSWLQHDVRLGEPLPTGSHVDAAVFGRFLLSEAEPLEGCRVNVRITSASCYSAAADQNSFTTGRPSYQAAMLSTR